MSSFESLGLQRWISKQCEALAMRTPTPVQREAIPAALKGQNIVGGAVTGSGKTAAFALPILQTLCEELYGVFALILTPSRELAYQIVDQFVALGAPIGVRTAIIIGGVSHSAQMGQLQTRPHVVVATPGRLKMILETFPETLPAFKNLRFLVLDEADRLLEGGGDAKGGGGGRRRGQVTAARGEEEDSGGTGFGGVRQDVLDTVRLMGQPKPFRRTMLFTATTDDSLTRVDRGLLPQVGVSNQSSLSVCCVSNAGGGAGVGKSDERSESSSRSSGATAEGTASGAGSSGGSNSNGTLYTVAPNIAQQYLFVPNTMKLPFAVCALRSFSPETSVIIFCNSCYRSEILRMALQLLGFPVCSLNSLLNQKRRLTSLALFKANVSRVLVATDVAARGLDIPQVDHVVHYDFPKLSTTYVHRVGRTGRMGKKGSSLALVSEHDVSLVHAVERRVKATIQLYRNDAVADESVVKILDEVSAAKVEAIMQVEEQFKERAMQHKEAGNSHKTRTNKAIRNDFAARHPHGTHRGTKGQQQSASHQHERDVNCQDGLLSHATSVTHADDTKKPKSSKSATKRGRS